MSKSRSMSEISRRQMLERMGVVGAALVFWPACRSEGNGEIRAGRDGTRVEPTRGGILRIGETGISATESLDPMLTSLSHTQSFLWYDQLTSLDADLNVQPSLAESWESNSDNTEWVFRLRPGVTFHDKKPLTAKDVVYTYKRMLDPSLGSTHALVMAALDPEAITAEDDLTVKFRLKFPMADVPDQAAAPFVSILPEHVSVDRLSSEPLGSGPFVFKEYVPGERSAGTRNPDYWMKDRPFLDEVSITWVADPTTKLNELKTGGLDLAADLSPLDARALEGTSNIAVSRVESGRFISFAMNTTKEPFDDVRVRQAFKLIQDRQKSVERVLVGAGVVANDQPIPPISSIYGYDEIRERDVEAAQTLLAEAGYPDGVEVELVTAELFPGATRLAEIFQEDAAEAGIKVDVNKMDIDTFYDKVFKGRPSPVPFFTEAYNFRPGGALLSMVFAAKGPWNVTGWSNRDFEDALNNAQQQSEPEAQREAYGEAERIISEEGQHCIPTFHNIIEGVSDRVAGYKPHPMAFVRDYREIGFTS